MTTERRPRKNDEKRDWLSLVPLMTTNDGFIVEAFLTPRCAGSCSQKVFHCKKLA